MENLDMRMRAAYAALDQPGRETAVIMLEMWAASMTDGQPESAITPRNILPFIPRVKRKA